MSVWQPHHRFASVPVDGDDGPFDVDQLQQLGNGGDLVGLLRARLLTQHEPVRRGPGSHQMQRMPPGPVVPRAAQRLAVNRHDLLFDLPPQDGHHRRQTAQKLVGLQPLKDAGERVRRGNAVGQLQELFEPLPLGPTVARQVFPRVALADCAAHRNRHDVHQIVPTRPRHARVCQSCKALRQNLQTGLRRHVVAPSVFSLPRTGHKPALDGSTSTAFITPLHLDAEALGRWSIV